jgi:hypothetical protein
MGAARRWTTLRRGSGLSPEVKLSLSISGAGAQGPSRFLKFAMVRNKAVKAITGPVFKSH